MPCRGPDEDYSAENHQLTRLLCSACKLLEAKGFPMPNLELERWWTEHKKLDAYRERQEQIERDKALLREQAIAKLTPEERKALRL